MALWLAWVLVSHGPHICVGLMAFWCSTFYFWLLDLFGTMTESDLIKRHSSWHVASKIICILFQLLKKNHLGQLFRVFGSLQIIQVNCTRYAFVLNVIILSYLKPHMNFRRRNQTEGQVYRWPCLQESPSGLLPPRHSGWDGRCIWGDVLGYSDMGALQAVGIFRLNYFFFFTKRKLSTVLQVIASISLVKFYTMLFHFCKVLFVRFSGFERVVYTEVFTS